MASKLSTLRKPTLSDEGKRKGIRRHEKKLFRCGEPKEVLMSRTERITGRGKMFAEKFVGDRGRSKNQLKNIGKKSDHTGKR